MSFRCPGLSRGNTCHLSVADGIALFALNVFCDRAIVRHVVGAATSVAFPLHHRLQFLLCVTQTRSIPTVIIFVFIPTLPVLLPAYS